MRAHVEARDSEGFDDERQRRERRALLDQMTREAEEMGLYDDPPADYRAALKDARRRQSRGASGSAIE